VADTWQGIMAPAGTPKDIVERLAAALVEIVQRPDVRDKLLHAGFRATGKGPPEFRDRIFFEVPKWKDVIANAHIKAE
jgi:tripartite-type tricarboxylate transporter receptor subunit TctC